MRLPTFALLASCGAPPAVLDPSAPALALPIACELGRDCWITNRPDVAPGPELRDHTGAGETYAGHNGTDLGVAHLEAAAETWVRAPVAGVVARMREGIADGIHVAGGELGPERCGNGAVLDAGDGWEVQLCHFALGSLVVSVGDVVAVGSPLGRVGMSGFTDHPHVHVEVRRAGRSVDPFTGLFLDDGSPAAPAPLWILPATQDALVFAGFRAERPPSRGSLLHAGLEVVPASAESLHLAVFLLRPAAGDAVRIAIRRPDGTTTRSQTRFQADHTRRILGVEKTWSGEPRPTGRWTAVVEWERGTRHRELEVATVLE